MAVIESTFPVEPLNELARLESYNKHYYRPANYIHKWWARRLGSVFRTILLALFSEDADGLWTTYYQGVDFRDKIVLDPFMGGGTTLVEALRLGCKVVGSDLNPVAWWTVKQAVSPVSPKRLDAAFEQIRAGVEEDIQALYRTTCPQCSAEVSAVYFIWGKQAPCVDCGHLTPLHPDYVLRYESRREASVFCPDCGHVFGPVAVRQDREVATTTCPRCEHRFVSTESAVDNSTFTCATCGRWQSVLEVTQQAQRILPEKLSAIRYACPACGEGFKEPSEFDRQQYQACVSRFQGERDSLLFPRQAIQSGLKTDDLLRHQYRHWYELFNARQLLALDMLLRTILALEDEPAREMMITLFSSTLEFNNMFCSYKGGAPSRPGAVRHIFSHHAFVLPHQPLENNLWGVNNSSGSFSALYRRRLRNSRVYATAPVERVVADGKVVKKVRIPGERIAGYPAADFAQLVSDDETNVLLLCRDSSHLPIPDKSVDAVVTDPPYFDNVQYAELADFFYVWLRLVLKDAYDAFADEITPKVSEVVKNDRRAKAAEDYQAGLCVILKESYRVLKDDGLLVFTFHHKEASAWETVLQAVLDAGFFIRATHPVFAEMSRSIHIQNQEAMEYDAIIVCKKQPQPKPITWQDLEARIQEAGKELWQQLMHANGDLKPVDASVIVMGKCLEFYSQHYPFVTDHGNDVNVGEAVKRMEFVVDEVVQYHVPAPAGTPPPPGDRTACRRSASVPPLLPRGCGPACTLAHR